MFKEYNVDGVVAKCRYVSYYGNCGGSVVVYINDEYVGNIDKCDIDDSDFVSRLRNFIKENV